LGLENPRAKMNLTGSLNFSQDLNLNFAAGAADKRGTKAAPSTRVFQLRGSLETPIAAVKLLPVAQAKTLE
jgi:hypothetical protein